jgi:3-hydroxyacyl-[acyl-carrier-protein] dehydratase
MQGGTAMADANATAEAPKTLEAIDIQRIMHLLPHRYPFLLVDKIVEINGAQSCIGIKNVTYNEPQFQGHFPGQPILPGVMIIEGMAQAAGCAALVSGAAGERAKMVYFMTVDKAKFRKPVVPGDVLEYHMSLINRRKNMWWFRGEAKVAGVICAEAELGAMIISE